MEEYNNKKQFNKYLNIYKSYWKNAFNFSGRTTRKDFLITNLINYVLGMAFSFIMQLSICFGEVGLLVFSILYALFCFANIIPNISISIRRLHDVNISCLLYIINLIFGVIFYIGFIFFIICSIFYIKIFELNIPLFILLFVLFIFVIAIKLVLSIVLIVYYILPSTDNNKYGPCLNNTINYKNDYFNQDDYCEN